MFPANATRFQLLYYGDLFLKQILRSFEDTKWTVKTAFLLSLSIPVVIAVANFPGEAKTGGAEQITRNERGSQTLPWRNGTTAFSVTFRFTWVRNLITGVTVVKA